MLRKIVVVSLLATAPAAAQLPDRPIQLVIPFSAGAGPDTIARAFAEAARDLAPKGFVVLNREGASGIIAMNSVLSAPPDGTTLFFGPQGQLTAQPHLRNDLPYKREDALPICQVGEDGFAVSVGEKSPFKSLTELVAAAKKEPGKLTYGMGGFGIIPHQQAHAFALKAGIDIRAVAYRNFGQIFVDAQSRQIDIAVTAVGSLAGKNMRVLAILGDRRFNAYPDVPTTGELGWPVSTAAFYAIYGRKGTPAPVEAKLREICAAAVKAESFVAAARRISADVVYLDGPALAKRVEADFVARGELLKTLNLKGESR